MNTKSHNQADVDENSPREKLTAKQEAFAQAIADGMTQADAYRTAYDASRMKDGSIHVNASKLMADAKMKQRVRELKDVLEKKAIWTREMSVQALVSAYEDGKPSEKISAVKELNLMHGYNAPQKLDHTSSDGTMSPKAAIDVTKLSTENLEAILAARIKPD